jgi:uncharacterized protein YaaN involved in tellurite resistance
MEKVIESLTNALKKLVQTIEQAMESEEKGRKWMIKAESRD